MTACYDIKKDRRESWGVTLSVSTFTKEYPGRMDMSRLGEKVRVVSYDKDFCEKYKEETTTLISGIKENCFWINWYIDCMTQPADYVNFEKGYSSYIFAANNPGVVLGITYVKDGFLAYM